LATASRESKAAKETKLIAALKQHYERYHAEDLAALKELYEYHAENCVKAAELTEDTLQREEYLKLARQGPLCRTDPCPLRFTASMKIA
jgi:hypothetical protein